MWVHCEVVSWIKNINIWKNKWLNHKSTTGALTNVNQLALESMCGWTLSSPACLKYCKQLHRLDFRLISQEQRGAFEVRDSHIDFAQKESIMGGIIKLLTPVHDRSFPCMEVVFMKTTGWNYLRSNEAISIKVQYKIFSREITRLQEKGLY